MQLITFEVDGDTYGIDINAVKEIKGWKTPRPMPNEPPHSLGVIELRGNVYSIYDLRLIFSQGETDITPKHVVLFVSSGEDVFGILVDAVTDIVTIAEKEIQPLPQMDQIAQHHCLSGIINHGGNMTAIVDLEGLRQDV